MTTNDELQAMAKAALDNWDFTDETDPGGCIKAGLEFLAEPGDFEQEVIESNVKTPADWDGLEEWARQYGSPL